MDVQSAVAVGQIAPLWRRGLALAVDSFLVYLVWPFDAGWASHGRLTLTWRLPALLVVYLAYYTVAFATSGRTVGAVVSKVRVVDAATAGRLPWRRAFYRALIVVFASETPFPLWPILLLAVGWPCFKDPYRQGVHDRAVGSVVIRS